MLALVAGLVLSVNPFLEEGRAAYAAFQWARAEQQLRLACEVPSNTADERYQAHDLLARTLSATGRAEAAGEVYRRLLSLDPHARAPVEAAPKIRELFQKAKQTLYSPDYVRLRALPAPPGQVEVEVTDPWGQVSSVWLVEDDGGSSKGPSAPRPERPMARLEARVSATLPVPGTGEAGRHTVEARNAEGRTVARLGPLTAAAPPLALVPPQPRPELSSLAPQAMPSSGLEARAASARPRWVPWTVAGFAAGAAVAGGVLGANAASEAQAARDARWGSDVNLRNERAQQSATAANVLFVGAAAAGVTAGVLFWVW